VCDGENDLYENLFSISKERDSIYIHFVKGNGCLSDEMDRIRRFCDGFYGEKIFDFP
jgi:hypothetical protein